MKVELPTGWVETVLGSIGAIKSGVGFPVDVQGNTAGTYPVYKVSDISKAVLFAGGELLHSANYVSEEISSSLKGHVFPIGSVLFAKVGEALRLNRRAIVHARGLADNNVMGFKAGDGLDDKFIFYFLQTQDLASLSRSTTIPSIRKGDVECVPIKLPPPPEQKRIALKLDSLLSQVNIIKARIDAVFALIRNFRNSTLAAAVSGRVTAKPGASPEVPLHLQSPLVFFKSEEVTAPGNWRWEKLVDVATLESGHTPRKSVPAYWEGGTVPWISLQDIRAADGKEIFSTKFMPTELGIENSSARLLPKGTVCFSRDISVGFVTMMGQSMATTQHFANWICGDELHPKYLMYAFMAGREHLLKSGQGSTVKTIYMPALKELRIMLPPLEEQVEIVRRVEQLFAIADQLEAKVATAKQRIDALTQSILAKAFRGELVPQDPNDEPASVLLERIRAQRAAAPKLKRGRKAASN